MQRHEIDAMSKSTNPRSIPAIAERLILLRESMGMGPTEFAIRTGIGRTSYAGYESGSRRPSLNDAIKLKMSLGVPTDWVYFGEEIGMPDRLISQIRRYQLQKNSGT
jgi:transcriptional regulator with XRE-family HTH domain